MRRLSGVLLVILAAICFGFMGLFGSWAMTAGVSVEMMLFLRFVIAGVVMFMVMMLRGVRLPRGGILASLIAMGAILYVGESMLFFHAMRHIPVGLVSLLLYIYPVVVTFFAWLVLKERLTRTRVVALALAMGGLLTIAPTLLGAAPQPYPAANPMLGVILGLGGCISYAIYILIGGPIARRAGAIAGSTIVIFSAAAAFGIIVLLRGDPLPRSGEAWLGIVMLAVVSTVIPITAVLAGLQRIGPVQTSTLSTLEPIVTVIVGAALMGQKLTFIQMGGGVLIVLAALIIARSMTQSSTKIIPSNVEVYEIH